MWVRFEGPGDVRLRRWHRVKTSSTGQYVTLCGRRVVDPAIHSDKGVGPECQICAEATQARGDSTG